MNDGERLSSGLLQVVEEEMVVEEILTDSNEEKSDIYTRALSVFDEFTNGFDTRVKKKPKMELPARISPSGLYSMVLSFVFLTLNLRDCRSVLCVNKTWNKIANRCFSSYKALSIVFRLSIDKPKDLKSVLCVNKTWNAIGKVRFSYRMALSIVFNKYIEEPKDWNVVLRTNKLWYEIAKKSLDFSYRAQWALAKAAFCGPSSAVKYLLENSTVHPSCGQITRDRDPLTMAMLNKTREETKEIVKVLFNHSKESLFFALTSIRQAIGGPVLSLLRKGPQWKA